MNLIKNGLVILFVCSSLVFGAKRPTESTVITAIFAGKIHGVVTDQYCAAIPKAVLTFKASRFLKDAIADQDGHFDLVLPHDHYQLNVKVAAAMKDNAIGFRLEESGITHIFVHVEGEATCSPCVNEKNEPIK